MKVVPQIGVYFINSHYHYSVDERNSVTLVWNVLKLTSSAHSTAIDDAAGDPTGNYMANQESKLSNFK